MVAIIISVVALAVSVLAYFKARRQTKSTLRFEYTDDGIIVYDKDGKEVVIQSKKL